MKTVNCYRRTYWLTIIIEKLWFKKKVKSVWSVKEMRDTWKSNWKVSAPHFYQSKLIRLSATTLLSRVGPDIRPFSKSSRIRIMKLSDHWICSWFLKPDIRLISIAGYLAEYLVICRISNVVQISCLIPDIRH